MSWAKLRKVVSTDFTTALSTLSLIQYIDLYGVNYPEKSNLNLTIQMLNSNALYSHTTALKIVSDIFWPTVLGMGTGVGSLLNKAFLLQDTELETIQTMTSFRNNLPLCIRVFSNPKVALSLAWVTPGTLTNVLNYDAMHGLKKSFFFMDRTIKLIDRSAAIRNSSRGVTALVSEASGTVQNVERAVNNVTITDQEVVTILIIGAGAAGSRIVTTYVSPSGGAGGAYKQVVIPVKPGDVLQSQITNTYSRVRLNNSLILNQGVGGGAAGGYDTDRYKPTAGSSINVATTAIVLPVASGGAAGQPYYDYPGCGGGGGVGGGDGGYGANTTSVIGGAGGTGPNVLKSSTGTGGLSPGSVVNGGSGVNGGGGGGSTYYSARQAGGGGGGYGGGGGGASGTGSGSGYGGEGGSGFAIFVM